MKPGQSKRQDYEYKRNGTFVVFMAYDIDQGIRYAAVKKRRTKANYAALIDQIIKEYYPQTKQVELVQDNLNTHTYGSFYDHLPADQARALAQKLHFHFTPRHGSWLNMAEIEFSVLARQCLRRRMEGIEKLEQQVLEWSRNRNTRATKIHWSFTVDAARQKLASQYVKVNENNTTSKNKIG